MSFEPGDEVKHRWGGEGVVIRSDARVTKVRFESGNIGSGYTQDFELKNNGFHSGADVDLNGRG